MRHLLISCVLLSCSTMVMAGDQSARPDGDHRREQVREYLSTHPEAREKLKEWIKAHPEAREKVKERIRTHLEQHPEARERLRDRRRSE